MRAVSSSERVCISSFGATLRFVCLFVVCLPALTAADWRVPSSADVRMEGDARNGWVVASAREDEFDLTSMVELKAAPGDVFEVNVRIRVDLHTRALPELACYDAAGREIRTRSSLETGPPTTTTNWQSYRRLFAVRPGTARVRARIRAAGRGKFWLADLEFRPARVDPYRTGALVSQIYPGLRRGLVLESNLGIVNTEMLTNVDEDGDGRWAVVYVDLDGLSKMEEEGVDWRTRFEYKPNELYWSDGAVLKSDSVRADRTPDRGQALHFRMKVHPGAYRTIVNDPGRAVAISPDGKNWRRYEGGQEVDLGTLSAASGFLEFWVDACYRDPVSVGPVYFDYVRVFPAEDPASVERLFSAARRKPAALARGSVEEKRVSVRIQAPRFAGGASWPVRCGLPIPAGELASGAQAAVTDAQGRRVPSQNRDLATWPDGSVKWLYLEFFHDFSRTPVGEYTVAYGNRVRAAAPPNRVRVEETPAGLRVDTGVLRFLVPKARFGILEDVRLASGQAVQTAPVSVEITEASGKQWRALELPVERLELEQAGPLHVVVLIQTKLAESGKPASGFVHRARIHAYAGSPLVEVDYFVANTDSRPAVAVRSICWRLTPAGRGNESGTSIQATEEGSAQGWVSLRGDARISAGIQAFREQYPKALRWKPDELELDLWAPEGGQYAWIQGVGKTHHIALYYGAAAGDASLLAHGPVLALADSEWYTASGAFGPIAPAARSPLAALEKTLAEHMSTAVVGRAGLGFENYGDHSSSGYVKGSYLWDNNEYDLPAGAIIHFVRTGDALALRLALASALHYVDVDTIHYSSRRADWAGAVHTHSHGATGHHTADNPNMHHAGYTQGLLWYSYFTGDPAGLEGARGIADWALRNLRPEANVGQMERALAHPLMTLNDLYEATWEEKYLRGSARLVDWATKWEHPVRSGFLAPITEQPAYYSGSPFCGGLLPSALLQFNSRAHLPEIDALLERVARSTLTDMWRPPALIVSKGGPPRRRAEPQLISSHLRLMRHEFERTGDPLFLAVPLESVLAGFEDKARPIGTRETGLIFNFLPWYLELLSNAGNPSAERGFEVSAPGSQVLMTPGGKARACFAVRNRGPEAVKGLRVSFQPRLDFSAAALAGAPAEIPPGGAVELCYQIQAPRAINLTCEYNRIAYGHWSATYRRQGAPHVAHAWVRMELRDSGPARENASQ